MRLELRKLDKSQMKIAQHNLNRSVRFLSSYAGLIVPNATPRFTPTVIDAIFQSLSATQKTLLLFKLYLQFQKCIAN